MFLQKGIDEQQIIFFWWRTVQLNCYRHSKNVRFCKNMNTRSSWDKKVLEDYYKREWSSVVNRFLFRFTNFTKIGITRTRIII